MAYPFPEDQLPKSLQAWQEIPVTLHRTAGLTPTQYCIRIDRILALADGHPPELADVPHVVTYQGKTYLFDGHHRWTLATIRGEETIEARNLIFLT